MCLCSFCRRRRRFFDLGDFWRHCAKDNDHVRRRTGLEHAGHVIPSTGTFWGEPVIVAVEEQFSKEISFLPAWSIFSTGLNISQGPSGSSKDLGEPSLGIKIPLTVIMCSLDLPYLRSKLWSTYVHQSDSRTSYERMPFSPRNNWLMLALS